MGIPITASRPPVPSSKLSFACFSTGYGNTTAHFWAVGEIRHLQHQSAKLRFALKSLGYRRRLPGSELSRLLINKLPSQPLRFTSLIQLHAIKLVGYNRDLYVTCTVLSAKRFKKSTSLAMRFSFGFCQSCAGFCQPLT